MFILSTVSSMIMILYLINLYQQVKKCFFTMTYNLIFCGKADWLLQWIYIWICSTLHFFENIEYSSKGTYIFSWRINCITFLVKSKEKVFGISFRALVLLLWSLHLKIKLSKTYSGFTVENKLQGLPALFPSLANYQSD